MPTRNHIWEMQQHTRLLLSVWKAPTAIVQATNPPHGKQRCRGASINNPKGIDTAH